MPPQSRKKKKSTAKYPKNTGDTAESGLDNFIIRTRRQSQKEKIEQSKMAGQNEEITQPEKMSMHIDNSSLNQINEEAPPMLAINSNSNERFKGVNAEAISSCTTSSKQPNKEHVQNSATNEQAQVKGHVAEIVDRLNATPSSSPVSSPTRKVQQPEIEIEMQRT